MIVVSDTSPIRALNHLGLLPALERLFGTVLIPPAVASELQFPRRRFASVDVASLEFVQVKAPSRLHSATQMDATLDLAETEALSLAIQESASVLVDESAARAAAVRLGLQVTGTLGILLEAKTCGLIQDVRSYVDRLQHELGFFISNELRAAVLQDAGE
ncbi:MAG TPA: DUF3368 domain-containing protein [Planctomycetaceae bacterium]|nr:DUF3368 domain-containing protein [Planctomycetaceae bacterium]